MNLSKRTALYVSLGAIAAYWTYAVLASRGGPVLPAHFQDLVWRIVRTKLIVLVAMLLLLRLAGEGFGSLGLTRKGWAGHAGIGVGFGLAMFVVFNVALESVLSSLVPRHAAGGPSIFAFFKDPANLAAWIPIGILGGGVVEELQRIFVLTRFEKWLGRPGLVLGVALSSAMFGLGHLYQGLGTAIGTGLAGVAFSLLYLRRRSAIEPIAAHALSDVLAVLAATMLAH